MKETLERIKSLVVGDKIPNWQDDFTTTSTRGHIADLCDTALASLQGEDAVERVARSSNRIWFDTEFIEDGTTIDLISIGMVRSDGATYYAETDQWIPGKASQWVKDNVLVHLKGGDAIKPRDVIAREIVEFAGEKPEFWAYYADYDWVALCQLFGTMMQLPDGWPMFCRDIKQRCVDLGNPKLPERSGVEHHALADALWNKQAWEFLATGLVPDEAAAIARLITETGSRDADDLKDMALVGHSTMAAIEVVTQCEGPFKDWSPAQDPAEIITDLFGALTDDTARPDEAAVRADSTANLISIIADIREKTGLGGKPMLNDLADAIAAEMDRRVADEREKIKDLTCESLLIMSDGYLNDPADDKVRVALSNAAVFIFGKERALRIRAAIRSGGVSDV